MKIFSVDVLDALASCERHETLRGEGDEPFAVFGSREQQFIGINSPDKYDQYMLGVDSQSDFGVLDSSSPTDRPEVRFCLTTARALSHLALTPNQIKSKIQKEEPKTCKNPQTPSSIFTFAALWDPETGFTAYEKGKLLSPHKGKDFAGHRPFNPSVDTSVSTLPTTHLYLPRLSKSRMRDHPIPSSTLEGLADPWKSPFFDPLSLPAEFREPDSSVEFQVWFEQEVAYLSDCIDHSESLGNHPDCEPHLVRQSFPLS